MSAEEHNIPDDLKSRYKNVMLIGSGAMGRVFRAHDQTLLIDVAIKVLPSNKEFTSETAVRFQQEAKAASKLKHKNVLTVMDFGISETGQPFLVMEYVHGLTLSAVLDTRKTISLPEAVNIVGQICEGMQHAHSQGVVHRDLKPANIMILGDDLATASVRILDFGIAKFETSATSAGSVTPSGSIVGTPHYMSPEQIDSKPVDGRTDIYSVGSMLFHMLTGEHPFEGDSILEVLRDKRECDAPLINTIGHHTPVPRGVESVVARCLERSPDNRYSSMHDLKSALEQTAIHSDAVPNESGNSTRSQRLSPKKIALIAIAACLVVVPALFLIPKNPEPKPAPTVTKPVPYMSTNGVRETTDLRELFKIDENGTKWTAKSGTSEQVLEALAASKYQVHFLKIEHDPTITPRGCAAIARMKELRGLTITDCSVHNDSLKELSKSKTLEKLNIAGDPVDDEGMLCLEKMQLRDLDLGRTHVTNKGLIHIARMPKLKRLVLVGMDVTDEGVKEIGKLPLDCLHLEHLSVTDAGVLSLENDKFERLHLNDLGKITPRAVYHLGRNKNLEELNLAGCRAIDDKCIAFIVQHWPKLKNLVVNDTKVTPAGIRTIAKLRNLEELGVADLDLKDADFAPLLQLSDLEDLNLAENPITGATLAALPKLNKLNKINLMHCQQIDNDSIEKLRADMPNSHLTSPANVFSHPETMRSFSEMLQ